MDIGVVVAGVLLMLALATMIVCAEDAVLTRRKAVRRHAALRHLGEDVRR